MCVRLSSGCSSAWLRALRSGRRGRWFESSHPDHYTASVDLCRESRRSAEWDHRSRRSDRSAASAVPGPCVCACSHPRFVRDHVPRSVSAGSRGRLCASAGRIGGQDYRATARGTRLDERASASAAWCSQAPHGCGSARRQSARQGRDMAGREQQLRGRECTRGLPLCNISSLHSLGPPLGCCDMPSIVCPLSL